MSTPDKPFGVPGTESEAPDPAQLSDEEEAEVARNQNRFDIRRLIGALFVFYGIVLTILGLVGSSHVKHKADSINIDLWTGIGMLIFGALMIFWALSRPVAETRGKGSGRFRRAPAT